jgi:Crp-like helix-turn-helix domain
MRTAAAHQPTGRGYRIFRFRTRLAKALLYFYEHSLSKPAQKLKLTQRDISQLIGGLRESANKQLRSWQRRKWLKLEHGGLTILAPDALRRLVTDSAD